MTTLDPGIYHQAADTLRRDGLGKNGFHTLAGEHCVVGALMTAVGTKDFMEVFDYAALLAEMLGGTAGFFTVVTWSDWPDVTTDDAVALLEQAAEKLAANR